MATFDYNRTNLGAATLSSSITAAATTATVGASDAATFPTAPFYATIMPVGETPNQLNSEIVQVTANNSGALGLVRAQRGTTAKAFDAGALVMNGVYIQDLEQAQAVGKSFFSATLTSGVYYINDSRVPTTPADGDSIRVVFGSNWTSGTPQLSLNNGTAKNIYAGNNLTSGNASTTTNAMVKSGVIYELTYYNGNWYVLNLVANNSITSDNMDWTTIERINMSNYASTTVTEITRANLYKFGRICVFNAAFKMSAYTANAFAYPFKNLPSRVRPIENFDFFGSSLSDYKSMRGLVNTNGDFAIIGSTSYASGTSYSMSGTYITN